MRYLLLIVISFFCSMALAAQIYKCVKIDGTVVYKDTPCRRQDLQSTYVFPTEPGTLTAPTVPELQQKRKRQTRARRKVEKQQQQAQERSLRLQAKCKKVMQQIELLNQRYRHGYTAKQGQSLDRKLADCKIKRQKYCKS